ncbi:MAG: CDP-2,3-bis-(O-geranylgeranyl)-sn-glycerol synthase [Candidatus Methanodesulfokora sp.]
MDLWSIILTIWYILPAYFANMAPVVFGGGSPIDKGRNWIDGKRILGDHKTFRGLISGIVVGSVIGLIQLRPIQGVLLSTGAMTGDLVGSFIKRRLDIPPGGNAILLDHEGFLVFSILFCFWYDPLSAEQIIFLIIITPILYEMTNFIARKLNLK